MRRYRGISLIELLVTMVVVAFGLLGAALMHTRGLQSNHDAFLFSQAAALAYDIAERMRVNYTAASAGNYNSSMGAAAASADCYGNTCANAAALAAGDVYDWKEQHVKALLPGADASIRYAANTATVVIRFEGRDDGNCNASGGAGADYHCYTLTFDPVP